MEENSKIKLDYTLPTMEARIAFVDDLLKKVDKEALTPRYLEILSDYIIGALTKEEKKEKTFLTDNRMITINKRETSFEGLVEKFESGEDGVYRMFSDNDKNILLTPKVTITEADIEEVPGLKELRESIEKLETSYKKATGRAKYLIKQQIIEMRKEQYLLKDSYRQPIGVMPTSRGSSKIDLDEKRWIDENGEPQSDGLISLFNPKHVSAILCHYTGLKRQTAGNYQDDFYYLMEDFDKLVARALYHEPLLRDLMNLKIQEKTNVEIQEFIFKKYNIKYSIEYLSSLWRNKIPKLIAEQEKKDYLVWHYSHVEEGKWKTCSICGQTKLAHNKFFSKNNTSKDGFYSQCKICRNKKKKKEN